MTETASALDAFPSRRVPLLTLLDPREKRRRVLVIGAIAITTVVLLTYTNQTPLWLAMFLGFGILLVTTIPKWRSDRRAFGTTAMIISFLVAAEGFHMVEHVAQFVQFHILDRTARNASGLISTANVEWVHFAWNWFVLLTVVTLIAGGMRNRWAVLLLGLSVLHTSEHTYLFLRHLEVLQELRGFGVTDVTTQGLPGIVGRDGWLNKSSLTQGTFVCRLPWLTTAPRLDVHFWWNSAETVLLLFAGNAYVRRLTQRRAPSPTTESSARSDRTTVPSRTVTP